MPSETGLIRPQGLPAGVDAWVSTRLQRQLPVQPIWPKQVHGASVIHSSAWQADVEADAIWTDQPELAVAVQTADCLPLLLADREATVVAAVHAGWRGVLAGVIEAAVAALPVDAARLLVWLGPAIGRQHFEVGPELRQAFVDDWAAADQHFQRASGDRWLADLVGLATARLQRLGVQHISASGLCTFSDPQRFDSHRRDRSIGRLVSAIRRA
jgi:YfiH family protein